VNPTAYVSLLAKLMLNGNSYQDSAMLIEMAVKSIEDGDNIYAVLTDVLALDESHVSLFRLISSDNL